MGDFQGTATTHIDRAPAAVFGRITEIDRLSEWNEAIESVEEFGADLTVGSQWVVVMHPPKLPRWTSRSRVEELDLDRLRFAYRTQSDDGNPSYALWTWEVTPAASGADVAVTWEVHPKTLGRRVIASRIRKPQLVHEVRASLARLKDAVTAEP